MKLKTLLLGLAAAVLMSGSASATPIVLHIAGSTAYRAAVTAAIINYLQTNDGGALAGYNKSSASQANLFGASQAIFKGVNGNYIIKTNWTGSVAGCVDLAENNTSLKWYPNSETISTTPISLTTSGTGGSYGSAIPSGDATTADNIGPELAMSDSFYTSVANLVSTEGTTGAGYANDIVNNVTFTPAGTYTGHATDAKLGIVPFGWWLGYTGVNGTYDGITNVPQQTAYLLTLRGNVPVSMLSGDSTKKNDFVYLIGRNEDSGTRTAALVESQGADITANNVTAFGDGVNQYFVTFTGSATNTDANGVNTGGSGDTVATLGLWPASSPLNTESTLNWNIQGHSGWIAGGDVKNVLSATNSQGISFSSGKPAENTGNSYLIGYLGWADGFGVKGGGVLQYNGVSLSAANILSGAYSFWTYEHAYYLTDGEANGIGTASANQALADGIINLVHTTYACTDANGNTATANFPVASSTVDANEDALTTSDPAGDAAPAGLIIDSAVLGSRSIEGGPYSLTY